MRRRADASDPDAVRRVSGLKSNEAMGLARNAYRKNLDLEGDWREARRQRLAAMEKRAAAPPADTSNRKPLPLVLFVTRHRASVRNWQALEKLLEFANEQFAAAQLVWKLTEPAEVIRSVSFAQRCPLEQDLDHELEWFQLILVGKLAEDRPVLAACGRCCLIPDRCSPEDVVQALGQLLGIEELTFSEEQIQWMRWQAWLQQGHAVPLPVQVVPVWCYRIDTPDSMASQLRSDQVEEMLGRANLYFQQAGLCFEFRGWYRLYQEEISLEEWEAARPPLGDPPESLTRFGRHCLHLVFCHTGAGWSYFPHPDKGLALLQDAITERALAQCLGNLLGLIPTTGVDQLMTPVAEGTRLSCWEQATLRKWAQERTGHGPDTPMGRLRPTWLQESLESGAPPEPSLPVVLQLLLVRGPSEASRQSLAEAQAWLEDSAQILAQAGITLQATVLEVTLSEAVLEAAYPNLAGAQTTRKPSCAGLLGCPAYDNSALNVFVLHRLPVASAPGQYRPYLNWPGPKVSLVAESFQDHPKEKQLALALAVLWGLKARPAGARMELLTTQGWGLHLNDSDRTALRATLSGLPLQPARPTVRLRLLVRLIRGSCRWSVEEARQQLLSSPLWRQHGIEPEILDCSCLEVPPAALQEALPGGLKFPMCFGLMRLPGYDATAINLFVAGEVGENAVFSVSKLALVSQQRMVEGALSASGQVKF